MAQWEPIEGTSVFLWKYLPSIPLAAIAILLFALTSGFHTYRVLKFRSWFHIPFLIGGLFQIVGYALRILSHYTTNQIGPYVAQSCFILLAPVFYAATIYMALSRLIINVHGEPLSIVRPWRMTRLFISGDILSLTVQGNAAGLTGKKSTQVIGQWVVTAGLFIQLIIFGFFIVAAVVWERRLNRHIIGDNARTKDRKGGKGRWQRALHALYACSALIIVRSVFRVVEYITGIDGYLLSHEWPMYCFDGVLMFLVQVVLLIWWPANLQAVGEGDGENECELVVEQMGES